MKLHSVGWPSNQPSIHSEYFEKLEPNPIQLKQGQQQ
jgi:hypothetical protein